MLGHGTWIMESEFDQCPISLVSFFSRLCFHKYIAFATPFFVNGGDWLFNAELIQTKVNEINSQNDILFTFCSLLWLLRLSDEH